MQGIRCLETEVKKGCLLLKTRWLTVWCGDWFNSYKRSFIYTSLCVCVCVCVCACTWYSDYRNNSKAPVCVYICVRVCRAFASLWDQFGLSVHFFLLYTTLKSLKIRMFWMRWLTDSDVFYHLSLSRREQ